MAKLEDVERLRAHTNVSYDEAREALDACGGDLLDAIIYLERQGKVPPPQNGGAYTTEKQPPRSNSRATEKERESHAETFPQLLERFGRWVGRVIQKGNRNMFVISQRGKQVCALPVTVFVILLILALALAIPLVIIGVLMIVGLFFDFSYRFRGSEVDEGAGVNKVMDSVEKAACDIKRSVQNYAEREDDRDDDDE